MIAPYNDLAGTQGLMDEHAADLAAILIEPMMGSGGCIPAERDFLQHAARRGDRPAPS